MKIKSIRIRNFRGYCDSGVIEFNNITAFIGRNDVGKSTILDALDIFFNTRKIDKNDINNQCLLKKDNHETVFDVCLYDLPSEIDIDAGGKTTLASEYLLNADNCLEVVMRFKDAAKPRVFVCANHPANQSCCDLLKKKNQDLKKIVEKCGIECDKTTNAIMRKEIWRHFSGDLQLSTQEIEVDSKDGEIKAIWEKLQMYLPVYSLFKSDRSNDDTDDEVQDPLKKAVKEVIRNADMQAKLTEISRSVKQALEGVAEKTCEKVREMAPDVADSLHPKFSALKWEDVFIKGISITGDQDIPISKRGSGVRRLILLNFFRAEAERKKEEVAAPNVIYAIEEPETSQHADFQIKLVTALKDMATASSVQVVITTHSSTVVHALGDASLVRIVAQRKENDNIEATVRGVGQEERVLPGVSLHEICYLAYKEASIEYHDELYGALWVIAQKKWNNDNKTNPKNRFNEDSFDKYLADHGIKCTKQWEHDDRESIKNRTLPTYIRNKIHHPENPKSRNVMFTTEELRQSIKQMRELMGATKAEIAEKEQ